MKKLLTVALLLASIILMRCSTYNYIPTNADLGRATVQWPDIDSTSLNNAFKIYKNKCGSCHFLYKPEHYSLQKWEEILPKMSLKAKLKDEEIELVKKYIYTHKGEV